MADLDIGVGALGGRVRATFTAIPPAGWVGVVALAAVVVLAWHYWDQDEEDRTAWTDPEQPPLNVNEIPTGVEAGPLLARARRWPGSAPGAC